MIYISELATHADQNTVVSDTYWNDVATLLISDTRRLPTFSDMRDA
jgi:hypothetical protein